MSGGPASVVLAGFRETGKTTFLVALWHTVLNNEVSGALKLETLYEGDRDYITKRHSEWLAYEPVMRTNVDHDTPIRMTLREATRDRVLQLGIPDLSGETFKVQFEERRTTATLAEAVRTATGVALFINPTSVKDPTRIRDVWDALGDDGRQQVQNPTPALENHHVSARDESASGARGDANAEKGSGLGGDFTASLCCTQVKYVDLLQQLLEHDSVVPLRCAVIVSAMDTMDGTEFEDRPEEFLRRRMSLLDQYLRARTDLLSVRIFGVSAQGGNYDPASVETLARLGSQRIRVCVDGHRDNDISKPVRWLAFGDE